MFNLIIENRNNILLITFIFIVLLCFAEEKCLKLIKKHKLLFGIFIVILYILLNNYQIGILLLILFVYISCKNNNNEIYLDTIQII